MSRSYAKVIMMLCLAWTLPSCGQGDKPTLYPVQGKVMFKGQPAEGATVLFQREDAPATKDLPYVPTGTADKEGHFALETEDVGYGAPAGRYKVLIQWRVKAEENSELQANAKKGRRSRVVPDKPDGAPDRLLGRFMKADKALIKVEVKPGENTLEPFDVSS